MSSPEVIESPFLPPLLDPTHPYFIHHSDHPGLILVNQPLTGENYSSWSRSMKMAITVKNKLGFIDGTLMRPDDSDQINLNSWIRSNSIVIAWILNCVSKEISGSIVFSDSAREIWIDLQERFQQSNGPRVFQIRREIMSLSQNEDPVAVYYTKLKSLSEELNQFRPSYSCRQGDCEAVRAISAYFQSEHIMNFLMGLNDSFAQIRSQILVMDPLPSINKVFALIVQEEKQRKISQVGTQPSIVFNAQAQKNQIHRGQSSNLKGNTRRDRPYCTHCKCQGHTIEKCYKIHGYPPGYKGRHESVNALNSGNSGNTQVSSENVSNMMQSFSDDQCQFLMSMLSSRLCSSYSSDSGTESDLVNPVTANSKQQQVDPHPKQVDSNNDRKCKYCSKSFEYENWIKHEPHCQYKCLYEEDKKKKLEDMSSRKEINDRKGGIGTSKTQHSSSGAEPEP